VGDKLVRMGARAVLIKGGHMPVEAKNSAQKGGMVTDVLWRAGAHPQVFENHRVDSHDTHGTGCTLASAIACSLAQGMDLVTSIKRARGYVHQAILSAPGFGRGHGPLNHAHTVAPFNVV